MASRQLRVLAKFTFPIIQFSLVEIGLLFILQKVGVGYTQITKEKNCRSPYVRVVTHNPPRVVTPISPCSRSVINKKAHGWKLTVSLWISSLFPRLRHCRDSAWSSIGERVTHTRFQLNKEMIHLLCKQGCTENNHPFFGAHEKHSLRTLIMRKILRSKDAQCNTKESP